MHNNTMSPRRIALFALTPVLLAAGSAFAQANRPADEPPVPTVLLEVPLDELLVRIGNLRHME